jgi:NADH dehydrogenase [ubiquinone] 1 alpha subcomplex assembly factor 7
LTALRAEIEALIATEGPITVERYMALCLGHPVHGYYRTRDPLGARGDFTTAPEISQIFGELIGLWTAEVWRMMGAPSAVRLVELGPGRGTLMADALRAARVLPAFRAAIHVHLVETSPALRARQEATLAPAGVPVAWHADLAEVPAGPAIVVANEFFDALPIRQFVGTERGWCERLVGLSDGALTFGLNPEPDRALSIPVRAGATLEWPSAGLSLVSALAARVASEGGAALVIDYGHTQSGFGDTLQAVRAHAYADPLADPGEADLTAHVDFALLAQAARSAGAAVHGPVTQGDLLHALGIDARAATLKGRATPAQAEAIDAAVMRLTGSGTGEMGALFKVLALGDPSLGALPGFGG